MNSKSSCLNLQAIHLIAFSANNTTTSVTDDGGSVDSVSTAAFPDCWSTEQYQRFTKDNGWLYCSSGKLGCTVCRDVMNCNATLKVSEEWVGGNIAPYGHSRAAEQTSLRKKMHEHRTSHSHKAAIKLLQDRQQDALKSVLAGQMQQQHAETCSIFRTAYYIAQSDRPYTDHPDLIELQELNGVDLGRVLHSNVICTDIVDHISTEMRKAVIAQMIATKCPFAVLIDESTSIARLSCMVVYVRATFNEQIGPVTFFLDMVELGATTAAGVEKSLVACLSGHGLTVEHLKDHWVGFGCDGASVMMGSKAGVAVRLKSQFPLLISWHCFNHRLELAVGDAVKCCTEINHFKSFMDLLYSTYSMSPKLQRELTECAGELDVQLNRIGRVLDVRWSASSCRTVRAVWRSYEALHGHFSSKVQDADLDSKDKAKFSGMVRKMENGNFIQNLGLMLDALEELADLSLALQKADITLPAANKLIARQVQVFSARKECDSEYYSEACQAVAAGTFRGITVASSVGKERLISKPQFYQALADSMAARLIPKADAELCKAVEVLDVNAVASEVSPEFGEQQLRLLCNKFGMPFSETKNAYREFKESKGTAMPLALKQLTNFVDTIPVSTAECERGFSRMNLVCSSLRSRLTVKHMSSLMFVSLSGPPLTLWKPLPYVKSWLLLNRRSATSTQGPAKTSKAAANARLESLWMSM